MNEWVQLGLVFLTGTAVAFTLLSLVRRKPRPEERRLEEDASGEEPPRPLVLGGWTEALSAQVPMLPKTRLKLEQELRQAGYYQPTGLVEYRAVRALLILVPLFMTGVLALLLGPEEFSPVLTGGLVATLLGFSLPRLYLLGRARKRGRDIQRGLPLAIDLLTLCLSAGQNLLEALHQVSRQLHTSHPVLAQELAITSHQAELHSLEHALKQWSDRVLLPEVTSLALVLIQSEKLGTDAAATLAELAVNYRTTARQRAEAQANRANFWLLLPSVFCFWVAAAIVLIGPAYLEFVHHEQETMAQMMDQSRKNVQRANDKRLNPLPRPAPALPRPAGRARQ